MKGIVFQVAQECCETQHGPEAWDEILADAGVDGVYTSLGNYDDSELISIVGAGAKKLGMGEGELITWLGESAIPIFFERYPHFFESHRKTIPFLLTLNSVIHPEVRKFYPGADVPEFGFKLNGENELIMIYQSKRKMCAFAEGLIRGTATHYKEKLEIEHQTCMNQGDSVCTMRITTSPA